MKSRTATGMPHRIPLSPMRAMERAVTKDMSLVVRKMHRLRLMRVRLNPTYLSQMTVAGIPLAGQSKMSNLILMDRAARTRSLIRMGTAETTPEPTSESRPQRTVLVVGVLTSTRTTRASLVRTANTTTLQVKTRRDPKGLNLLKVGTPQRGSLLTAVTTVTHLLAIRPSLAQIKEKM